MGDNLTRNRVNDEFIREKILEYLYIAYNKAQGPSGIFKKFSDIYSYLKKNYNIRKTQVSRNLTYLVKNGWIEHKIEKIPIKKDGKEILAKQDLYSISKIGIDYFEPPSKFKKPFETMNLNINNIRGVVVIGNNNIVRTEFKELYNKLDSLEHIISNNATISEQQKLELIADIESLKDQLMKQSPDKSLVKGLLKNIRKRLLEVGIDKLTINLFEATTKLFERLLGI